MAVVLATVAAAVAYLHSAVDAYLHSAVNGPASVVDVSVLPGMHAPPKPSAAELRAALTFTRCMRAHGLSQFPDPRTTVSLAASLTLGPNRPTDAQASAFRQAAKSCGLRPA